MAVIWFTNAQQQEGHDGCGGGSGQLAGGSSDQSPASAREASRCKTLQCDAKTLLHPPSLTERACVQHTTQCGATRSVLHKRALARVPNVQQLSRWGGADETCTQGEQARMIYLLLCMQWQCWHGVTSKQGLQPM
jgi:hypothetical protein